jgi:hypothetical protein
MADEQQLRLKVNQRLIETGQKEVFKEQLRNKLVESGWRDKLREHCKGKIVDAYMISCRFYAIRIDQEQKCQW